MEPDYACGLIQRPDGSLLLEQRGPGSRFAAGHLTCFGGRRKGGERALQCLRRELREELGWRMPFAFPACDLWVSGQYIARFFAIPVAGDDDEAQTRCLVAGNRARWLAPGRLDGAPLSPWHDAVIAAWRRGVKRVDL